MGTVSDLESFTVTVFLEASKRSVFSRNKGYKLKSSL